MPAPSRSTRFRQRCATCRRIPAVSTNLIAPSGVSTSVSMASRVVPGRSWTTARSSPIKPVEQRRLPDVRPSDDRDCRPDRRSVRRRRSSDLRHRQNRPRSSSPARGWPRRVLRRLSLVGKSRDHLVEQVPAPPSVERAHHERVAEAERHESPRRRSRAVRCRPCSPPRAPCRRPALSLRARASSSVVTPTVESTTKRTTSAAAIARSA